MVRYLNALTPLVIVGTVGLLTLPWLGLIALVILPLVAVAALATFAWAIVFVPYTVGLAIVHRWRERSNATHPTAALSLAERKRA